MEGVPHLGRQPELLPVNLRLANCSADLVLISICPGCIYVTVTRLDRVTDRIADLTFRRPPCPQPERRRGCGSAEILGERVDGESHLDVARARQAGGGSSTLHIVMGCRIRPHEMSPTLYARNHLNSRGGLAYRTRATRTATTRTTTCKYHSKNGSIRGNSSGYRRRSPPAINRSRQRQHSPDPA